MQPCKEKEQEGIYKRENNGAIKKTQWARKEERNK